ncbi:tetratricopeptide repeat protein [Chenggangzhangella methanolivorans]|uniref:tetratricopeptide repeat protein n=1 Tax=Chenggangzhangella methanolivorans TaxID=1437009 RepID=UPI00360DA176
MADIFQEVQEDLRRDRLKAFWDRYGTAIVVVMVVVVAGVGGWRGWQYYENQQAETAGDRYEAAAALAKDGKTAEARAAFAAIAADGPAGYSAIAKLREADEAAKDDKAGALKLYQAIANDAAADGQLRDAARVRGAFLAVDAGSRDDVKALAEPLAATNGAWSTLAREAMGLAAYKAGDMADARRQFEAVVADPEAPGASRQRADLMLAVLPAPEAAGKDASKPVN